MKSILYLLFLCSLLTLPAYAQIGMGGQPHPSAALDVQAPDKAFYPPRLTSAQRNAIVSPQPGAFVYDIDKGTFYLFDGQNWSPLLFTSASNLPPIQRTASDGVADGYFGVSVAISGDYALVGAHGLAESAYIFVRSANGWTEQAKLTASDGSGGDNFGVSVAISGNYALVGASYDAIGANPQQGSAYVFVRSGTTWTQQAKLTAGDGTANDNFGSSVAISGDYAIVGAPNDDNGAVGNQGSAYALRRSGSTWITELPKLTASDGAADDLFGCSVAVSGSYALVGAKQNTIGFFQQGAAYVFLRVGGTWSQQARLTASDFGGGDLFGSSVAISGDYALVGAPFNTIGGNTNQGAAYVYMRTGVTWSDQIELVASDGAAYDYFGYSVAISGDYAVVGGYSDDVGININQGSAYLFKRSSTIWVPVRYITDNSPTGTSNGFSAGLSNGLFIIGGPNFELNKGKVSFGTVDN